MSSSTFSSRIASIVARGLKATVAAAVRMGAAFGPSLAVAAAVLVALAVASQHLPSQEGERGLEAIIVREQIRRARTVRPDLLIVGDSSALMGVDARLLSRSLHVDVESLATLGWVGPAGYAQFVRAVSRTPGTPKVVLLLMCGAGLQVEEPTFAQTGYEAAVLQELGHPPENANDREEAIVPASIPAFSRQWARTVVSAARERVYTRTFLVLLSPPLPGRLGFYYGWPEDIARAMDRDRGSLVDPTLGDLKTIRVAYQFSISDAVRRRLPAFAAAARTSGATNIWFGITPVPQTVVGPGTLESRAEVASRCLQRLGLSAAAELPAPAWLPATSFATFTHLNALGRQRYSEILVELLRTRLGGAAAR